MTLFLDKDGGHCDVQAATVGFRQYWVACDPETPDDPRVFDRKAACLHGRLTTYFVERGTAQDFRFRLRLHDLLTKRYPAQPPAPEPLAPLPFTPNIGPRHA